VDEQSRLKQTPRILVVEDHDDIRRLIALILRRHGYAVSETSSPIEALDLFASGDVDLAIVELLLPGTSTRWRNGINFCFSSPARAFPTQEM
jgi:DNA-binding response OmpR family regulator